MIGTTLGPYEITARIGEGGMGEVYRAHDTQLKRDVANKVLPAAFVADPERIARFEREAQLLAQLHHPNIASVFGLEKSGGLRALVMELVEGPTLADRLAQGALPLEECLSIARQIAEALEGKGDEGGSVGSLGRTVCLVPPALGAAPECGSVRGWKGIRRFLQRHQPYLPEEIGFPDLQAANGDHNDSFLPVDGTRLPEGG